jgi:DNA-binding transcriptional LysR family regulator
MLDLNQVLLFVEIVRAGSFAEAARRLGMPANTVSRHIRQLEAELDSRLLHRSTRKLTLTAAGQAFFDRCAPSIAELSQAGQELDDENRLPGGLVRVAAPAGFFDLFPVEWVAEFLATHPRARMEFVLDDAKADLVGESIDVAFRAGSLMVDSSVGRKLLETRFTLVASPSYLAARGMPEELDSLTEHDCLPLSNRSGPVTWRLDGRDGLVEVRVSGRFRANTARAVLQAAVAGMGIALLPAPLTGADLDAGRLVNVLPHYRQKGASLYAVFLSRRQVPRAVSAFVEFTAQKFQTDPTYARLMPA